MLAGEKAADVDVSVAVATMEAGYDRNIDMIAIASRDADYLPAVQAVKKLGKEILIIGVEPGFSKALQRAADHVEMLQKKSGPEQAQHGQQGQQRPQQQQRYNHHRHNYQQQRRHHGQQHHQNPQHNPPQQEQPKQGSEKPQEQAS
jgi:hypothetical protein